MFEGKSGVYGCRDGVGDWLAQLVYWKEEAPSTAVETGRTAPEGGQAEKPLGLQGCASSCRYLC